MPVDNRIYDTLADWWDPAGQVAGLHAMNPARSAYFLGLLERLGPGGEVLELGCGGGILTEALLRAGRSVTGVDLAQGALGVALAHGRAGGLGVRYARADASRLPFADGHFAAVVSSDFLEHVADVGAVVREAARVLRPGGHFLFDTINRTLWTRLFHIGVVQRWKRLVPPDTHDWKHFVKPRELAVHLRRNGLEPVEVRGLLPEQPLRFLLALLTHRRGKDRMLPFRIGRSTALSYVGYAVKPGDRPSCRTATSA